MNVTLAIVPPDGGETDYQIDLKVPHLPRSGEYIYLSEEEFPGVRAFLVRNIFHQGKHSSSEISEIDTVVLEVEFIEHPYQSDSHKQSVEMYKARGYTVKSAPETAY
ncbi:hypothetical protein P5G60_06600 [Paenibacillus jamilae]|nr:hypothetical protein [Paenibacillus jamilae]